MKILVGLGNPGPEYAKTRHNIGFMVVDKLTEKWEFPEFKEEKKIKASVSKGEWKGESIVFVKPLTFMNLSGEAVRNVADFYKVDIKDILVIYDDIDLPFGTLRFRPNGGSGTHNGMRSIVQFMGEGFPRLRLGIETRGETTPAQMPIDAFVLSPFNKQEEAPLEETFKKAIELVETEFI